MGSVIRIAGAALALALVAGACNRDRGGAAATEAAAEGSGAYDGVFELIIEMQQIEEALVPLQTQALEDEALAAQLAAIQAQVDAALREADPALLARADELEAALIAAQEAGDGERFQIMIIEAQIVYDSIQSLRAEILERPEIRGPIDAFEAAHRARMIELDPRAEELLARIDEIMAELDRRFGQAQ